MYLSFVIKVNAICDVKKKNMYMNIEKVSYHADFSTIQKWIIKWEGYMQNANCKCLYFFQKIDRSYNDNCQ